MMITSSQNLIMLIISMFINILLMTSLLKRKNKNQLSKVFILINLTFIIWIIGLILQITLSEPLNINPIYFDYFVYVESSFTPVVFLFMSLIFANTKIKFKKKYILLFIIPIASLLILWTNDYHHLFYEKYSVNMSELIGGPYLIIHNIYSYTLLFIGIFNLLRYSIKNSGIFSKQSILIVLGASVPIIVNILGTFKIIPISIYITPITFTVTMIILFIAIFKFKFLSIAPIALQKVVDRISDSYLVLNEENTITDFNETFLKTFKMRSEEVRTKNIFQFIDKYDIDKEIMQQALVKAKNTTERQKFEIHVEGIDRYFTVEINTIIQKGQLLGTIILLKDVTQHKMDIQTIKDNQEIIMEKERLSALGQMIGGIAHNLKTPIMSIAGGVEGIVQLVDEYEISIDNPQVNSEDHHEIVGEMREWITKIKSYLEYMSDIITAVKGQAVSFNANQDEIFTVEELVKIVDILMKHELKTAIVYLNIKIMCDPKIEIRGNVNSLVQVINNMIANSIQAYSGKEGMTIDLIVKMVDDEVIISVKDYGPGLPEVVLDKLFKEMVTTKGKNGTGLGLYMSYSNIKAHFRGDITVETSPETGTRFNIMIPLN